MKEAFFNTPPRKPAEHHGMAEKKPRRFMQVNV